MTDHLSPHTSHLSHLSAGWLSCCWRWEPRSQTELHHSPGPTRPRARPMWGDLTDTRARLSGPPRERREREREAEGKYEVFDPSQFKWRRQELSHLWQWRYLYAFQFKLEVIRAQSLLGEISLILRTSRLERLGGYHRCIILFWLRSSNLL